MARLRNWHFKISTIEWRLGHFNVKRVEIDVVIHLQRGGEQRVYLRVNLFEFPVSLKNLRFHIGQMSFASLLLKALTFRIGCLRELILGTLRGLLRLFGLANRRDMAPNRFSLCPLSLSCGHARLMLKFRKESSSCHGANPYADLNTLP